MKNEAFVSEMAPELFDNISNAVCSVMAGDYLMELNGYCVSFGTSGTKVLLDNLVKEMPVIFRNNDFVIGLLHNIVRFDRSECLYDSLLCHMFTEYVDESLRSDKDVVMYFIQSLYSVSDNPEERNTGAYENEILEFCHAIPHELFMDSDVFHAILEKVNPVSVYRELFTDEERVDDHIVFRTLWSYREYCRYYTSSMSMHDAEAFRAEDLRALQEYWIDAVEKVEDDISLECKFHDMEESDFIRERNDGINGFFRIFFDFLMERDFLVSYKGIEPVTIREKSELYLQYLCDTRGNDAFSDAFSIPDAYYSECPFACEYLMDIVKKYWYQICLFAAVGTDYHNMLAELCGGYVNKMSNVVPIHSVSDEGDYSSDSFMCFDESGTEDFPFC